MLDKILAFIAAFLKKTTTTTTLTPEVGTGSVYVMQFGKVVLVSGEINTTTAIARGDVFVKGLPTPKIGNALYPMTNNSTVSEFVNFAYLNTLSDGLSAQVRYGGNNLAAASRSYRLSMAYIAA